MATKKVKAAAKYACQSRNEVMDDIKSIGDMQREIARLETKMNDAIANITAQYAPRLKELSEKITVVSGGVQAWCESNRDAILNNNKTVNFVTGEAGWRLKPPSVKVTGEAAVCAQLNYMGLTRFVRVKESVNKEAILNEKEAVAGFPGIVVQEGVEDFFIAPFENEFKGD